MAPKAAAHTERRALCKFTPQPLDSALSGRKAGFPGGPERPTSGQLPAGLGAVEFQRGSRSHKWRPYLPGSPINHVALIGMPEVDLWGRKAS